MHWSKALFPARHVWMAPDWQGFFSRSGMCSHLQSCVDGPRLARVFFAFWHVQSLAVMCPAFDRGTRPLALMGSVDRTLIMASGSRCPMTLGRVRSIRRLTDIAITRFNPRKSSFLVRAGGSGRHGA